MTAISSSTSTTPVCCVLSSTTPAISTDTSIKRGAHPLGENKVAFSVYAPAVADVYLELFDGEGRPTDALGMKKSTSGHWDLVLENVPVGTLYRYQIGGKSKIDPYGYEQKFLSGHSQPYSAVVDQSTYQWQDSLWIEQRPVHQDIKKPFNFYEVHLSHWRRDARGSLPYRTLAVELANYCQEMGYTHVELLGLLEHPCKESWGYQVTGYFAPNHRLGSSEDFKWMVDYLHQRNIGVVLDWVPAHFANDSYSLKQFDTTLLYEYPKKHPSGQDWGTFFFNFQSKEAITLLIESALFWLEVMHLDGLRVDAVGAVWELPGGKEFLQQLNKTVHAKFPGALMISEDTSCIEANTRSISSGGFGFDLLWNVKSWDRISDLMKRAAQPDPQHKIRTLTDKAFSVVKDLWFHNVMPACAEEVNNQPAFHLFSHDSVGHTSLFHQCPGSESEKYAFMRVLMSYKQTIPGKQLTFMGTEIGQQDSWDGRLRIDYEVDWGIITRNSLSQGIKEMSKDLNQLYLAESVLWNKPGHNILTWVDRAKNQHDVVAYTLQDHGDPTCKLLCIHSLSKTNYEASLPSGTACTSLFCCQDLKYGGTLKDSSSYIAAGKKLTVPPFTSWIIKLNKNLN